MTPTKIRVPGSVTERFETAFEWYYRLHLAKKPALPVPDWKFDVWYCDGDNKQMYEDIRAIFLNHTLENLQVSADPENSIALSDVPKLMKELVALIVGNVDPGSRKPHQDR